MMNGVDFRTWYEQLSKPAWTPSPQAIGVIWTILYPIIAAGVRFVL